MHSSSSRKSGAGKDDVHKAPSTTSRLSPTRYKNLGMHTRSSQPLSATIPFAPSPPQYSSPTISLPPATSPAQSPQSPSLANVQLEEDNTFNNNDNQPKPERKKRGMTQLKGLGIHDTSNAKMEVVFNEKGQPICDSSITLASFIGALVRNKVPITFDDWRGVSSDQKTNLWTLMLLRYKLDETHKDFVFQKMAASLREYRRHAGNAVVEALKLDEAEKVERLAKIKPENLTDN